MIVLVHGQARAIMLHTGRKLMKPEHITMTGILIMLFIAVQGCGQVAGTLDLLNGPGKAVVEIKKGERIELWNSIKIQFSGDCGLGYYMTVTENNIPVYEKIIPGLSPDIRFGYSKFSVNGLVKIVWKNARIFQEFEAEKDMAVIIEIKPLLYGEKLEITRNSVDVRLKKNK
ncbi:MAG: hypothetical protein JW874_02730 [Spirochaetales bacterium]|nr:hypothetical protein [Spirochaetales bacterium]